VESLVHLFWLVLFIAVGFPIALGIELYLRGGTWWKKPPVELEKPSGTPLFADEFMRLPEDSGIARRMREPAHAAVPEQD
jgi:hypothetical protein